MLWLFGSSGAQSAYLPEASSIVTTEKFRGHSTIAGEFSLSDFSALRAARYCQSQGDDEIYSIEHLEAVHRVVDGEYREYVEMRGRSVTSLPHLRIIEGTMAWASTAPGAMVKDILDSFTGARALPLAFGTGNTLGTATSNRRSWKDAGDVIIEILEAAGLGVRSRMDGTMPTLDVFEPNDTGLLIGDKHGDGNASAYIIDDAGYRNYAIVLGQGVGDERVRVDVDLRSVGEELRELIVDADDIKRDGITEAAYEALLTARGTAKLAECRKVEYGEAEVGRVLRAGDIVYYDAGVWAAKLMVTEAQKIREDGTVRRVVSLGWPEPGVWETVAKVSRGATNIAGGTVHVVGAAGEPAFANSWVANSAAQTPRFFFAGGMVKIEGAVKNGTMGAAAFTLPEGFRPPALRMFACVGDAMSGSHAYVYVGTNGAVVPAVGVNTLIALDSILFLPA